MTQLFFSKIQRATFAEKVKMIMQKLKKKPRTAKELLWGIHLKNTLFYCDVCRNKLMMTVDKNDIVVLRDNMCGYCLTLTKNEYYEKQLS